MRRRRWPIGAKFIALLLTPIISLVALWVFATSLAAGQAQDILAANTNNDEVIKPGGALVTELQRERRLSVIFLGSTRNDATTLVGQRASTDTTITTFRRSTSSEALRSIETRAARQRIERTLTQLDQLLTIRQTVEQRQLDKAVAFRMYTSIIDSVFRIYPALPGVTDPTISRDSQTLLALGRAREMLSQEDAWVSGIAASGRLAGSEPGQLAGIIGTHRFLLTDAIAELPSERRSGYEEATASEAMTRLRGMENRLLSDARTGAPLPIDLATWQTAYDTVSAQLAQLDYAFAQSVLSRTRPVGVSIMVRLGLAAVLGLIAIAISIGVSVRVWRSLIGRLTKLEHSANALAAQRLPSVVRRLRAGEHLDVSAEAPPFDFGEDEIGQVGQAFNDVQRTAIESAVNEARLRSGVNRVFLNIARRSQTLLHRQLSLLDAMERDTVDPQKLQELFQIDHLATRMRRHAEDLVILAGAAPARGWRTPVVLVDVIRGAISEVEDYARITLQSMPEIGLAGPVVADLTHLLAELLENASAFSPPEMPVFVGAQLVPGGLAIDIEDRGLGMPPHAIDEANERLANPPEFDPANSARLGLFVVATLAARHRISVSLRRSPYGGVTAIALIPPGLIVEAPQPALPAGPSAAPSLGPAKAATATTDLDDTAVLVPAAATVAPPVGALPGDRTSKTQRQTVELTADGLPRRRRQASLAPQLREDPPPTTHSATSLAPAVASAGASPAPAPGAGPDPAPARSPEDARASMSSLRAGTLRGRQEATVAVGTAGSSSTPSPSTSPENASDPASTSSEHNRRQA
ncbi:MAG: nitrate- and nitrite sensing domain-containing protein [Micromonosporaceae bacterium]|nr:nitrate- and nitrite sensing domain-containing protein [Micromonosporaceae bacterium]